MLVDEITPLMVRAAMKVLSEHCDEDGYFSFIGATEAVEAALRAAILARSVGYGGTSLPAR